MPILSDLIDRLLSIQKYMRLFHSESVTHYYIKKACKDSEEEGKEEGRQLTGNPNFSKSQKNVEVKRTGTCSKYGFFKAYFAGDVKEAYPLLFKTSPGCKQLKRVLNQPDAKSCALGFCEETWLIETHHRIIFN
ncbi:hypothetical protein NC652_035255 [Populus alba x Populus x berolinensis]|nr:hypothetical protein NC652_035255 [Populus alba x Populus x berolinensis]